MVKEKRCLFFFPFLLMLPVTAGTYGYLTDGCEQNTCFVLAESASFLSLGAGEILETEEAVRICGSVSVVNNSPGPAYVRALVLPSEEAGSGSWYLTGTSDDWYYDSSDGYYYYRWPLEAGASTLSLMDGAVFSKEEGMEIPEILIYEECVLAANGETLEEAWGI